MRSSPYVPSMVQAITVLTVLKMMTKAQTSCGQGLGRIMYERLPNQQLQGFDDDVVRDTAPPFQVLEKCQDLCLRDRTSTNNIVRTCTSFDFQPGGRIVSYGGTPEYEESTCYLTREEAAPEGIGTLMNVPNSIHFTEVCISSSRPDRECPNRRYVFERHPRKKLKLPSADLKEMPANNRTECENLCLNEFSFVCRSATFDSAMRTCFLSRFTRRTHPELLDDDAKSDYLENTCLNAERRCDGLAVFVKEENRRLGGPFEVALYMNLTLDECQSLCLRAEKYFCRSIEFDDMTKQCTLSEEDSVSQKDDLGISSSPSHHFYDLVCLDNPRGSEYPDNSITSHLFSNGRRPDTAFQRYRNSRLGGEFHSEITGRTLSECLDECLRQTSFQCRSAVYSDRFRTCRLSRYNQKDDMRIIYDADYDYYENLMPDNLIGGDQGMGRPDTMGQDSHTFGHGGRPPIRPGGGGGGGGRYPPDGYYPGPTGGAGGRYPPSGGYPGRYPPPDGLYPPGGGRIPLDHPSYPGRYPNIPPNGRFPPPRYPPDTDRYFPGDGYPPGNGRYPPGTDRYVPGDRVYPPDRRYPPTGTERYPPPSSAGGDRGYPDRIPANGHYPPPVPPPRGDRFPPDRRPLPGGRYPPPDDRYPPDDRFGGNGLDYFGNDFYGHNRWWSARPGGHRGTGYPARPLGPDGFADGPPGTYGGVGPSRPFSSRCDEGENFKQIGARQRMRRQFVRRFVTVASLAECQRECVETVDFICRSFNYREGPAPYDTERDNCELSDRDTRDLDPNNPAFFDLQGNFDYYERSVGRDGIDGECLDVSQACNEDGMEFTLRTPEGFVGRIYTYGFYDRCFFRGNGGTINVLRISGAQGYPECGTQRYGDTMTNIIVVQFSDYVQTSKDKRFNLTCIFRGPGEAVVTSGYIGAGSGSPIPIEYLPAENTLSSKVRLMILYQGRPTTTIAVGDPLTFRLEPQDGSSYLTDIFASNVIARDPYSGRSVQLIDRYGCPVDSYVFPELDKGRGDSLEAHFNAFKIPESNFLVFEATVRTCRDVCQPAYCPSTSGRSEPSFGRRRRDVNATLESDGDNSTVLDTGNSTLINDTILNQDEEEADMPEYVREMIEVYESRDLIQQDARRAVPLSETVCLTPAEYNGMLSAILILLCLLIVVALAVGFAYRRYWSVMNKNVAADRSSHSGYPTTRSSGLSIFGTGLQKPFQVFGHSRNFPGLVGADGECPAPGGPFEDPSEPIYTDPSLFERSRSLRSISVSHKGHRSSAHLM